MWGLFTMSTKILKLRRNGFTLIELMVTLALLAITIIFGAAAITQSRRAFNHAKFMQGATAYAKGLIEETKGAPPSPAELPKTDLDRDEIIASNSCHVNRTIYPVQEKDDYAMEEVVVKIEWPQSTTPLIFSQVILVK